MTPPLHPRQLGFISDFSAFARSYGLPKSAAKILGYLLICSPSRQTAQSIQQALALSTGSVNIGVTMLKKLRMVERSKAANSKQYFYEILPHSFEQAILGRIESARQSRMLAEKGLEIDSSNERLIAMREVFGLIEAELPRILKKFDYH